MANLRTPCEGQYQKNGDSGYTLTTFTYSKCFFSKFEVNAYECFPVNNYVYMDAADQETFSSDEEGDGGTAKTSDCPRDATKEFLRGKFEQ